MYALRSPNEAYRRVDFDARVAGADPRQLVLLCYEQLATSLGTALHAERRGDNACKSQALTRALVAITALQMGVDPEQPISAALLTFLDAARQTVLGNVTAFDSDEIARLRSDIADISAAFSGAQA